MDLFYPDWRRGTVPRPHQYGPLRSLNDHEQLVLLRLILENPGIYLKEIQAAHLARFGVEVAFMQWVVVTRKYSMLLHSNLSRAKYMAEIPCTCTTCHVGAAR